MSQTISKKINHDQVGLRLDKALSLESDIQSRSRAEQLIDLGLVLVNTKRVKSSYQLKEGDLLEYTVPKKSDERELTKSTSTLDILYEDEDLLVINKPSGLVVHPAPGHYENTLVNILISQISNLSMGFGENRPGIVHRIDKETSGILVVAKNDFTHEALSLQFKKKTTRRIYEAVVIGYIKTTEGTIQSYLSRHPIHRKKFSSVLDDQKKVIRSQIQDFDRGKWAVTHFKVIKQLEGLSLLQVQLETGRTHQIRVHLSELGFPIVGDGVYGAQKRTKVLSTPLQKEIQNLGRFLLHAKELGFEHPRTGQWLNFTTPWPLDKIGKLKLTGL